MDFQITLQGRTDLSRQIYRQMRSAILHGRLRTAERLPSSRELALQLSVARKTVTQAYELLLSESLVTGSPGSGTYVSARLVSDKPQSARESELRPRAFWRRPIRPTAALSTVRFDLSVGTPDVSLFPHALWRSLLASSGRVLGDRDGHYGDPQGEDRLREAIARYIAYSRAVICTPEQIVITHGAQQGFDLVARVLLEPGDTVAVEEPGYPPVRDLFASHHLIVKTIPLDGEGIRVSQLPRSTRLVYVTPSHQFPLGLPMSLERKMELIRWAAEHRACILEDDYDSEFRFDPRPLEALQSLDARGLVVYVGTLSKVLHPGIRVGFVVAPRTLVPALVRARKLTDWHEPLVTQVALARFIAEGHLARHVRRMSKVYRRRRDQLLKSLNRYSDRFLTIVPSVAGLHVACRLHSSTEVKILWHRAQSRGIRLNLVDDFSAQPDTPGVVFGFGNIIENNIPRAVATLFE